MAEILPAVAAMHVSLIQRLLQAMDTAQQDAPCITALRAAGAILIGKANLHEAGAGMTGLNAHYGPVRNPHNMQHMAGGSSSGCAALVAAGICPFAIGGKSHQTQLPCQADARVRREDTFGCLCIAAQYCMYDLFGGAAKLSGSCTISQMY